MQSREKSSARFMKWNSITKYDSTKKMRIINEIPPPSLSRIACLDMPLMDGKPQPVFEVSRRVFFFSNDLELDCGLSARRWRQNQHLHRSRKANCCWWVKLILAYSLLLFFASEHYAKGWRRGGDDDEDKNNFCFTLSSELICHVNFRNCSLSFRKSSREKRSERVRRGDTRENNSQIDKPEKIFLGDFWFMRRHSHVLWAIATAR